jgi:hypothetical protein
MGYLYSEQGEINKALEYMNKSNLITVKIFGENHHSLVEIL